ncbi:MAG: NAD(P)-dependent oxidoreductase [Actinomycetota bacterium]|nr:NAD(P)-dependent oxidoreductase [Actinomycetota bacterium]
MRVALLGTGTMGAGMARSLKRAGLEVAAWNRTRSKAEPLAEDGVDVAAAVEEAVSGADAVLTMLFDVDSVLAVTGELLAALGDDAVWLQASTVGPSGVLRIADAAGDAAFLDTPMLGTKQPAAEGKLVALASGDRALVDRVEPVLGAIAARTVYAGTKIGQASALKLACNAWIASITAATAQSVSLAAALSVDPGLFLQAIDGGPTNAPYAQLKGKAMIGGDFAPSFAVDGVIKDIDLMRAAGSDVGFPTDLLDALRELFARASKAGHGADDMAAIRSVFP